MSNDLFPTHARLSPVARGAVFIIASLLISTHAIAGMIERKSVLVTGASTGIGRKIAERLAAHGYLVYAGARKESDVKTLSAIRNIHGIRLDVTSSRDISDAFSLISKEGHGLYGLVNNAGIVSSEAAATVDNKEFDQLIAVNIAGPFRMVQAFAPLITAEKGRIVNIGSTMGTYAVQNMSVYCMTKFAIEAFTESLQQEMSPLGVKVSVIEPGTYRSEIERNAIERQHQKLTETMLSDEVAAAAEFALSEVDPKPRYLIVPSKDQHESVIKAQIEKLVELNEGQRYTYDRATLFKMLEERLARSRPKTH
jgi:NAD(P)-dependent dehydrogenase (short-subunit alcohol dehydrogenase family)